MAATAPTRFETDRLLLRKPSPADADAIFDRYSSDPRVTRYLGWPRHTSVNDARGFLAFSDAEWQKWPAGPYLIESLADRRLLGGTGFTFETPRVAVTGYVLAQDAWGVGYATEALAAIVAIAGTLPLGRPVRPMSSGPCCLGARAGKMWIPIRRAAVRICRLPQPWHARAA